MDFDPTELLDLQEFSTCAILIRPPCRWVMSIAFHNFEKKVEKSKFALSPMDCVDGDLVDT